jgi:hypothetical protein
LSLYLVNKSPVRTIEAVPLAYLAFTLTWFECAQFTHLAWWALSLWGVSNEQFIHSMLDDSTTRKCSASEKESPLDSFE